MFDDWNKKRSLKNTKIDNTTFSVATKLLIKKKDMDFPNSKCSFTTKTQRQANIGVAHKFSLRMLRS